MAGFDVNFGALRSPMNVMQSALAGYESGQAMKRQAMTEQAVNALLSNPNDENASRLFALDPQQGAAAQRFVAERDTRARESQYRSALAGYAKGPAAQPPRAIVTPGTTQPNPAPIGSPNPGQVLPAAASPAGMSATPPMSADPLTGQAGQIGQGGQGVQLNPEHQASIDERAQYFQQMMELDPEKALEFRRTEYSQLKDRLDVANDAYGFIIRRLANVNDDAGYQQVLSGAEVLLEPLGVDVRSMAPPTFPGQEGVRTLLTTAMDAKDQVAAWDRKLKLDWDIQDDEFDNERADRDTNSRITDRDERRGLVARGQDVRAATTRRGQDMTDKRVRERPPGRGRAGGGGRGRAAGGITRTATGPDGRKVGWNGSAWVDLK